LACDHLQRAGLSIVARGYRCRHGELDLVCRQGAGLVIVEVRARRHLSHVSALESVDRFKQQRIITTARHFLMTHPRWANQPLRFDVVAIDGIDRDARIQWIRAAFDAI
jgi:putative endonuclease